MPKLRILSGDAICKILALHGFTRKRQKGSHIVMQRVITTKNDEGEDVTRTITVIVPDHDEVKTGTLASLIRQSELSRELFETK